MKLDDAPAREIDDASLTLADRWILSRAQATIRSVDEALETYRFDHAADLLYRFAWRQFCDWYIEFVKVDLVKGSEERRRTAQAVLLEVLDILLRLLHPMIPFITEELWSSLPGNHGFLARAEWPEPTDGRDDPDAEAEIDLLRETIVKIRNLRAESNIDPGRRIGVLLHAEDGEARATLREQTALIAALVRAETVQVVERFEEGMIAARGVIRGVQIALPLEGLLDLDAERARIAKDLDKVGKELAARARKLANPSFVERAPAEVVEKERRLHDELGEREQRLRDLLAVLGGSRE